MDIDNSNTHLDQKDHSNSLTNNSQHLELNSIERLKKDDLKQVKHPKAYILDDTLFEEAKEFDKDFFKKIFKEMM